MWICSQHGFYSIVEKKPGEYHVRARKERDLINLALIGINRVKIHRSKHGDYRWRMVVGSRELHHIVQTLVCEINYSNFKDRIHQLPDQREKSSAYATLWSNLHRLQENEPLVS